MTKLLPCSCKHSFQQRLYGDKRVHNDAPKAKSGKWRCTVCLTERNAPGEREEKQSNG